VDAHGGVRSTGLVLDSRRPSKIPAPAWPERLQGLHCFPMGGVGPGRILGRK
jgi:hypothetical protein